MTDSPLGDTNAAVAALEKIVKEYGSDSLSSPTRLSGLLADLLPDQPRLVRLLTGAAEDDVAGMLRGHLAAGMDVTTAASLSAAAFAEASVFLPEACAWVVGAMAIALGLADEAPAVLGRPVATPAVTPAGTAPAARTPADTVPAAHPRPVADSTLAANTPPALDTIRGTAAQQPTGVPRFYGSAGTMLAALPHGGPVNSMKFSPDGSRIVTTSKDMTARLWRVEDGRELAEMRHARGVASAAFSPNGARIVTMNTPPAMGSSRIATLWQATDGRELVQMQHGANVIAATFSPDSHKIATSDERIVRLWDAFAGTELVRLPHADRVTGDMWAEILTFSADSAWLVATSGGRTWARLWAVATGWEETWLQQRDDPLRAVQFSPDSTRMLAVSSRRVARLFETPTRRQVPWIERMDGVSAAFSKDSQTLATASSDRAVRLWSAASGAQRAVLRHDASVTDLAFSADGAMLATTGQDMAVRLWDTATGQEIARMPHKFDVTMTALNDSGDRLCTVSAGVVQLWDVPTCRVLRATPSNETWVAAVSPDRKRLGIVGKGKTVLLWDTESGTQIARMQHDELMQSISFSPDSRILATRAGRKAQLWAA
jgi:WD40 repeat protein